MKKKLLVTAMAAMPVLGMFGGDFTSAAVTNYDPPFTQDTTESVTVNVTQPSTFSVVIPKEITLKEANPTISQYAEAYTVEVTGNIAGTETVTVKPAVTDFEMKQTGKDALNASVTQTVTEAKYADLKEGKTKSMDGSVVVDPVTAGRWTGTFDFNISKN